MDESRNIIKHCEICNSEAKNICFKCLSYFCESCYKFVHEKNINADHKTEKIDYFVPINLKCPEHPKMIMILFCVDEQSN